ncbi:substrate-binding domain-containing protein [Burkholderia ubonensis]|uniref:substrate-binding domain-containing protein n=1 Tax=Burkholderia ubonensis TaxID=101571 RepID=UPI002ABE779C|nr:substrate-binding domain-containing protein [Burkholderia ubonensis]
MATSRKHLRRPRRNKRTPEVKRCLRRTADAIIFANENLVFGALLSAPGEGIRVPEQCAIVGFDDYPTADMLMRLASSWQECNRPFTILVRAFQHL